MAMHGFDQSQAVTKAAQVLSSAREQLASEGQTNEAIGALAEAKVQYNVALQQYIDPFKLRYDWDKR